MHLRSMNVITPLALTLSVATGAMSDQSMEVQPIVVSVTMEGRRCVFWTGDNGMNAKELRTNLTQIQGKQSLVVYYGADVPDRCVSEAHQAAQDAGFDPISAKQDDREAGPIGPPINVR